MSSSDRGRLLVVSHPAVLEANQAVYVKLVERGWNLRLVVPARWRHEFAARPFAPAAIAGIRDRLLTLPVLLAGRPQRHVYLARAARVIAKERPLIVFIEAEAASMGAWQWGRAARRARVPFGVQVEENLDRKLPLIARLIRSASLEQASFLAARSPAAERLARAHGARGPAVFVPHGVPEWVVPPRRRNEIFTIGFAGRLVPEKGVLDLLAAARALNRRVQVVLVGDGPLRSAVTESADDHVNVVVRSDVPHERMADAYASMDVLVLPSRTTSRWAEQYGRVLTEALWCGVPVIGSDSGEIPWIITQTGGGLVFPEGDIAALAERLQRVADDDGLAAELAQRGRDAVVRDFSLAAAAEALDAALLGALSAHDGPR
ncbi:MAG TPA: glycosyltransferase family 4 protein [Gaiellaceae bacterium]|nr:glycosyltransferase family 4 protein [Gaiellaceae bacterium]